MENGLRSVQAGIAKSRGQVRRMETVFRYLLDFVARYDVQRSCRCIPNWTSVLYRHPEHGTVCRSGDLNEGQFKKGDYIVT